MFATMLLGATAELKNGFTGMIVTVRPYPHGYGGMSFTLLGAQGQLQECNSDEVVRVHSLPEPRGCIAPKNNK